MVKFTCDGCGLTDEPVRVHPPEPGEAVGQWARAVIRAAERRHRRLSAACNCRHMRLVLPASVRRLDGPESRATEA